MDVKPWAGGVGELGSEQSIDVGIDLSDLIRGAGRKSGTGCVRVRERSVWLRRPDAPGEVVALVDRNDEERVALVDAARPQVLEEGGKGVVIRFELPLEVSLTRPIRVTVISVGGDVGYVDIVGV